MGFGLLFVGYLFAFGYTAGANYILSLVGALGTVFLYFAGRKLRVYSRAFCMLSYVSLILCAAYLIHAGADIANRYFSFNVDLLCTVSHASCSALMLLCNLAVYAGCFDVASLAEDRSLKASVMRNFLINAVSFVMKIAVIIIPNAASVAGGVLSLSVSCAELILLVLNVFMTLSFYMRIHLDGDDDADNK